MFGDRTRESPWDHEGRSLYSLPMPGDMFLYNASLILQEGWQTRKDTRSRPHMLSECIHSKTFLQDLLYVKLMTTKSTSSVLLRAVTYLVTSFRVGKCFFDVLTSVKKSMCGLVSKHRRFGRTQKRFNLNFQNFKFETL